MPNRLLAQTSGGGGRDYMMIVARSSAEVNGLVESA